MPVSVIPFNMPEPMAIPEHIADMLRELSKDEAVARAMELLMDIDVAEAMIYERLDQGGHLELGQVLARPDHKARELRSLLEEEEFFGKKLSEAGHSLAGQAFASHSALLLMGQVGAGEEVPLPAGLRNYLLAGAESGSIGFIYVLTFTGQDQRPLGALTLIRSAAAGPLNHEQPNIAEGVRRELSAILDK